MRLPLEPRKMKVSSTKSYLSVIALFLFSSFITDAQDATGEYPVGIPTDKPGILISPFPPGRKLDVTGLKPGSLAMDPSVEKIFRIPVTATETKGNVGKKTGNYEDYTGKNKKTPPPTTPAPTTPPTISSISNEPAFTLPNRVASPTVPSSMPGTGNRIERPRDPGLGSGSTILVQPKIGSERIGSPTTAPIKTTSSGLPIDLMNFVYAFNGDTSNNSPTATLGYFATEVLYFGKSKQDHNDIAKDRAAYIRKYPSRKYTITAEPTLLSAKNGIYELVSPVSYTVQGLGKRSISGKVLDYLIVRKTADSYLIVGIDETKTGVTRPTSLHKAAEKLQNNAPAVPLTGTPLTPPVSPDKPIIFTGSAEEQINQLVAAFIKSGESNDPAACLQFVDPEIAVYYDLRHPDRNALIKDRSDYIKQWPQRTYELTTEPDVKEIGDRIYEVVYEIKYQVRNNSRTVGGKETSIMQVAETEQGMKIISIFDK